MPILVASNLSPQASRAVARAFRIAADLGTSVTITHLLETGGPDAASVERSLQAEAEQHRSWSGIEASIDIVDMASGVDIADRAARANADLVVMGAHDHGRRGPGRFVHTLAGRTLSELGRPILIAEAPADSSYQSAVVGVDFSIFSRTAIRAARRFAPSAQLHLVHAYAIPFRRWVAQGSFAEDYAYSERLAFAEFLEEEMGWLKDRAGVPAGQVETHIGEGDTGTVLRDFIARTGAPLAVVGTHGRTGVSRMFLGSVAAGLLDDPPADLLVVPMAIPAGKS